MVVVGLDDSAGAPGVDSVAPGEDASVHTVPGGGVTSVVASGVGKRAAAPRGASSPRVTAAAASEPGIAAPLAVTAYLTAKQRQSTAGSSAPSKNFYPIVFSVSVCVVVLFIEIAVAMLIVRRNAEAQNSVLRQQEAVTGDAWASVMRTSMTDALVSIMVVQGYVMSAFPYMPPFNATPDATGGYNVDRYLQRFPSIALMVAHQKPGVLSQAICPGGVITMTYPYDASSIGRDLLSPSDPTYNYTPTPIQRILSGKANILGPKPSTVKATLGTWIMIATAPIYNKSLSDPPTLENFWGFVYFSLNMSGALSAIALDAMAAALDVDYVVYEETQGSINSRAIASTLPNNSTAELEAFIASSTITEVLAPFSSIEIAVRSRKTYLSLSADVIAKIILGSMLADFCVLAVVMAIILWCRRDKKDAARHAPKMAPFAMLTIGPLRGAELWDLAPGEMAESTVLSGKLLARQMARHKCYSVQPEFPYTVAFVTRYVSSAVQMAFSVIEELQRHPVDAQLRAVLGEDAGRLEVCCAVHWCTDAAVRVESLQGSYRYEGPDVVFGSRMWAFAAPGVVTASAAVVEQLPCRGLVGVEAHAYQTVEVAGVGRKYPLYALVRPDQPQLAAAAAAAIEAANGGLQVALHSVDGDTAAAHGTAHAHHARDADAADVPLPYGPCAAALPPSVSVRSMAATLRAATTWNAAAPLKPHAPPLSWARRAMESPGATPTAQEVPDFGLVHGNHIEGMQPEQRHCTHSQHTTPPQEPPRASPPRRRVSSPGVRGEGNGAAHAQSSHLPPPVFVETDVVTRALMHPVIPRPLETALHNAFGDQAAHLNLTYEEMRPLVYYFYTSYTTLLRALAAPERHNIFRRLVSAFGVPQQGVLEHLAVCGALQWLAHVRAIYALPPRVPSPPRATSTAARRATPSMSCSSSASTLSL